MTSVGAQLGRLIADGDAELSDDWVALGRRAIIDTVGVMIAGADEPAVGLVAESLDEVDGPVRSLATGRRLSSRSAALLDGTSAHALDYDDVDDALIAHLSAVLVPALLIAAQRRGASGRAVLAAYRAGLQSARTVGAALDVPAHYAAGWHPTGTVGTIAAAAAAAALLGLDERRAVAAVGVAGSLACGNRQNFGTMTKPLHVGSAAASGLTAAFLAANGFTASADELDGPVGFLATHGVAATAPAADPCAPHGLNTKLFPCCYATHAAIEATLGLRPGLPPGDVKAIDVVVAPGGLAPLIHRRPDDGARAKFSMEYVVSVALLDGRVALSSFEDQRVSSPDVQTLLRRVTTSEDTPGTRLRPSPWSADVTVRTVDGATRTARVDHPAGHASRSLEEAQIRTKFEDCLVPAPRSSVGDVYAELSDLHDRPDLRAVVDGIVAAVEARHGSGVASR